MTTENKARNEYMKKLQEERESIEVLKGLLKHPGWKVIENNLLARLDTAGKKLRKANDLLEIGRSQGMMEELEFILRFIPSKIEDLEIIKDELEKEIIN